MPRIYLLTLVGLPGAGKSSLCGWLLDQQAALPSHHLVHLCYDEFLDASLAYKEQRLLAFNILQQLISAIQGAADWPAQVRRTFSTPSSSGSEGFFILCDDNFYYRSMRYKLHQLCRSTGCVYGQIYMARSLDSCLKNNARRRGIECVPESVVRQMHERMEPPGGDSWERHSLTLSDTDAEAIGSAVLKFLNSIIDQPADEMPPAQEPADVHAESTTHNLDLLLRERIKFIIQGFTGAEAKRAASGRLNEQRKQILAQFRANAEASGGQTDLTYYVHLLN
ncbi:hypothetical protein KR009_012140 [Drosophila setifemur]|nr:hypothetical protein KR009_012140 [Drosophila setifemur]